MAKQTYSRDFKVSAAKLVTEQGRGLKEAATGLGVPTSPMPYWVRRFGTPAARPQVPDDPAALRRENEPLREENEPLLMEREILKKATAFSASEQARDSPSSATTATSSRWR
jgi:transposase